MRINPKELHQAKASIALPQLSTTRVTPLTPRASCLDRTPAIPTRAISLTTPTPHTQSRRFSIATTITLAALITGCATTTPRSDIARLYNEAAKHPGDARNPVIVIPGILGSKLVEPGTGTPIWGAFIYGAADADTPEGARLVALPMAEGVPLADLRDDVVPTEVLDTLKLDVGLIRGVELGAYVDILKTIAAGKHRDQTLARGARIDYAGLHYTCFQFAYDWRRDVAEQASALHQLILDAQHATRRPAAPMTLSKSTSSPIPWVASSCDTTSVTDRTRFPMTARSPH